MQVPTSTAPPRAVGVSLGGLIMVAGGLLITGGSLFPWFDLLSELGTLPVETNKTAILVAGVVTLCAGVVFMTQRPRFQLASIAAGGAALVALIMLIEILFYIQAP